MTTPQVCSTGAITSFPLQLAITATEVLYDAVSEPITMDIQWSARSTPPMFIAPKTSGITDEVGAGNTNLTTLRFMNNNYTVASVQIIRASHSSWILPTTAQANNKEDIVIIFSTESSTTQYSYITFVIPVIRSATGSPTYLTGLSNPNANGPFTLQSCFPTNSRARFAYYATCLAGYSQSASTQNMYVFVSTDGIQVSSTLMTTILGLTGRSETFGTYAPPFLSRLTPNPTIVRSVGDFTNYVMTTTQLLNYAGFKQLYPTIDTNIRQDDTSAYQCVSIDPDKAVVDGQLHIDLTSGEVLTDVLDAREAIRATAGTPSGMDPGRFEKYMGSALGILLSIILFGSILYAAIVLFVEAGVESPEAPSWIINIPVYVLLTLVAGFIGFIVGSMLS
jgi:hypothetical protein